MTETIRATTATMESSEDMFAYLSLSPGEAKKTSDPESKRLRSVRLLEECMCYKERG